MHTYHRFPSANRPVISEHRDSVAGKTQWRWLRREYWNLTFKERNVMTFSNTKRRTCLIVVAALGSLGPNRDADAGGSRCPFSIQINDGPLVFTNFTASDCNNEFGNFAMVFEESQRSIVCPGDDVTIRYCVTMNGTQPWVCVNPFNHAGNWQSTEVSIPAVGLQCIDLPNVAGCGLQSLHLSRPRYLLPEIYAHGPYYSGV